MRPLWERLQDHLQDYTPEKVQAITGVHADTVRKVARDYAKAKEMIERRSGIRPEVQRAIDLLQERRTALISAAVTGQIDVRNLPTSASFAPSA